MKGTALVYKPIIVQKGQKVSEEDSYTRLPLNLSYADSNDSIRIDLGKVMTNEQKYVIEIEYVAKPEELKVGGSAAISTDKGLYFINP
ncbi:hypothetical protein NK983_27955, partial [Salmonella enterica subsp. enterica serovar Typhimurium]|nr:hypothetical protein [Salmonella enterica subsp. enterica serovar Typhimurium]